MHIICYVYENSRQNFYKHSQDYSETDKSKSTRIVVNLEKEESEQNTVFGYLYYN